MNIKLTLSVEEEIIVKAKAYAKANGKSLSQIVENYLGLLVKEQTQVVEEKSITYQLKDHDLGDYKEELAKALSKKYLNE
jgi:Family of unknown function (DUF6364)